MMKGVLTSRFHNPEPSYSWESLSLDEVKRLTDIQLNHKGWKIYFTNFHDFQDKRHTKECMEGSLYTGYTGCACNLSSALVAIWKAGTLGTSGVARNRELFVNVPHEKVEDKSVLTSIEKRTPQVQELLFRGFEQLITLLKVYEVTGLILEFGPPMRLYTEDTYKVRRYVREIDGDVLWEMLHNVQQEDIKKVPAQIGSGARELSS